MQVAEETGGQAGSECTPSLAREQHRPHSRVCEQEPRDTLGRPHLPSTARLARALPAVLLWTAESRLASGEVPHTAARLAVVWGTAGRSMAGAAGLGLGVATVVGTGVAVVAGCVAGAAGCTPLAASRVSRASTEAVTLRRPPVITLSLPSSTCAGMRRERGGE